MKTKTCLVAIGHYTKLVVPVSKVGAVLNLLSEVDTVRVNYHDNDMFYVLAEDKVECALGDYEVITADDFDAIKAETKARTEAEQTPIAAED